MARIGQDLQQAKELLQEGQLVAIPTETVYGLAANALSPAAVAHIFTVKNRPQFDPLIVHVPDVKSLSRYSAEIPPQAKQLAEKFWPGPLTLLLKKNPIIPDLVTSGMDTVGLRCPDHSLTLHLLRLLDFPLAAPSANPFGYVSPTTAQHVDDQLGGHIPYILDGGACTVGIESTIVGFEEGAPVVYRLGGLSLEAIEAVIGKVQVMAHSTSNPKAPGQLKSHYAPRKKVIVGNIEELLQQYPSRSCGLLTFQQDYNSPHQFILSAEGSLEEAAQRLFSGLRAFDNMPIDIVLAEYLPNIGLGRAINDRLSRAAASGE